MGTVGALLSEPLNIMIGWDAREAVTADVLSHSIRKRTKSRLNIKYLKHRELRKQGLFMRPWITVGSTGDWLDINDGRPFSTEFSHTRFLVPKLMNYQGWALFMDSDMVFMGDIKKLFDLADPKYAIMVVKHQHIARHGDKKMDGREQLPYARKNWSSFVLWNCGHEVNRQLSDDKVNCMRGQDLHGFSWIPDYLIGELPFTYNYISGVSPKLSTFLNPESGYRPDVIHYTEGGPWFEQCSEVPYADIWLAEYEDYQRSGGIICDVPTLAKEGVEIMRK